MKIYTDIEDFKVIDYPVVTIGGFDGVHLGHQKILKRLVEVAKKENGEAVLITFYPHPRLVLYPEDRHCSIPRPIVAGLEGL